MLDRDLAELYGVETRALNQAVARNRSRFPEDFAFSLTAREVTNLISQSVISKLRYGTRKLPRVFTEQGVAMLSSVLRSQRAIAVNIAIMRAFVRLRELALTHADLTRKLAELEKKYDGKFAVVFRALHDFANQPHIPDPPRPRVGFVLPPVRPVERSRSLR